MKELRRKIFGIIFSIISSFIIITLIVINIGFYNKEYNNIKNNLFRMNEMSMKLRPSNDRFNDRIVLDYDFYTVPSYNLDKIFHKKEYNWVGYVVIIDNETYMKCDIYESDNNYHIEIDLPGFKREHLNIEYNHGYLTVLATKKEDNEINNKKYIKRERTYGVYKRDFYVGNVDYTKINAKYKDGVLIIDVMKTSDNKDKKTIEIK